MGPDYQPVHLRPLPPVGPLVLTRPTGTVTVVKPYTYGIYVNAQYNVFDGLSFQYLARGMLFVEVITNGLANNSVYVTDQIAGTFSAAVTGSYAGTINLTGFAASGTGLTIGGWRQRQRLLRALELLAQGTAVTSVALAVGYRTPSAFTAMFHEQLGTTPTRYFRPDG